MSVPTRPKPFRPEKIRNILFDWSGTLFDDFAHSYISTKATIRRFGGPHLTPEKYRKEFDLPVWKFYRRYIPKTVINEIDRFYFDHFQHHSRKAKLYPHVVEILKSLKCQGVKLFIFSTVRQSLLEEECRRSGIYSSFKEIIGSVRDKERTLPALCRRLRLKSSETLFVGDMEHDLEAARKAGILSGAMLCGYHAPERLIAHAPDFIWQDHGDLLRFIHRRSEPRKHPGRAPENQKPISTVGALIFNQGDIFLIQTHKWGHTFGIPGGKIQHGETMIEALKREIHEETAMKISNIRWAMTQDCIHSKEFYKPRSHFLLINYYVDSPSRRFKLNDEAESGFWVNPKTALKLRLNQPTRLLLETYFRNHAG